MLFWTVSKFPNPKIFRKIFFNQINKRANNTLNGLSGCPEISRVGGQKYGDDHANFLARLGLLNFQKSRYFWLFWRFDHLRHEGLKLFLNWLEKYIHYMAKILFKKSKKLKILEYFCPNFGKNLVKLSTL